LPDSPIPQERVTQLLKKRIADLGLTYRQASDRCGEIKNLGIYLNGDQHLPATALSKMIHGLGLDTEMTRRVVLAYFVYELPPAMGEHLLKAAGLLHHLQE
jgi:hypothetical protein